MSIGFPFEASAMLMSGHSCRLALLLSGMSFETSPWIDAAACTVLSAQQPAEASNMHTLEVLIAVSSWLGSSVRLMLSSLSICDKQKLPLSSAMQRTSPIACSNAFATALVRFMSSISTSMSFRCFGEEVEEEGSDEEEAPFE
jgi:hypothetical protein